MIRRSSSLAETANDHDVRRSFDWRHAVASAGNVMIVERKRFRGSVMEVALSSRSRCRDVGRRSSEQDDAIPALVGSSARHNQPVPRDRDHIDEAMQVRQLQREADADPDWYSRQVDSIEQKAQILRLRQEFYRAVRTASRPYAQRGWRPLTGGMATWPEEGHLLHIGFIPTPNYFPFQGWLHARVTSPYLYAVATGKPLTRIPAAQATPVGCITPEFLDVRYAEEEPADATPAQDGVVRLTAASVSPWLAAKFASMTSALTALGSDRGMRDWLLADNRSSGDYERVRLACLLTKHLGEFDRLPRLLQLAEETWERAVTPLPTGADMAAGKWDRQRRLPLLWSHKRWLKHFDAAPE
jgi:hypothetical protein